MDYIDITQSPYNCVGDGSTDNREGFFNACAQAVAQGKVLFIPAGTFLVTLTQAESQIRVTDDLVILGASKYLSTLKFGPEFSSDTPPEDLFNYKGFSVEPGANFDISNLSIHGSNAGAVDHPDTDDTRGYFTPRAETYGIYMEAVAGRDVLNNTVGLRDVNFVGKFAAAIYANCNGPAERRVLLEIDRCDITAFMVCVYMFGDIDGTNMFLHISDSKIHDSGGATGGDGHLLYIHPHVACDIRRTQFSNLPAGEHTSCWCIHQYGSGNPAPRYNRLIDNLFDSTVMGNAILSSKLGRADIEGNTFQSRGGCYMWGDAVVKSNFFACSADEGTVMLTQYGQQADRTYNIIGNHWDFRYSGRAAVGIEIHGVGETTYVIEGNTFDGRTRAAQCISAPNRDDVFSAQVIGNRFIGKEVDATGAGRFIVANAGGWYIANNVITGPMLHDGGAIEVANSAVGEMTLVNNKLSITRGHTLKSTVGFTGWQGWGNEFAGGGMNIGASDKGFLHLRAKTLTSAIASASIITLDASHDTYRISGTTTIERIYVESSTTQSMFDGSIVYLIADERWALSAEGNIVPLSGGTANSLEPVRMLMFDGTASKWFEVGNARKLVRPTSDF